MPDKVWIVSAETDKVAAAKLKAALAQLGYDRISKEVDDPVLQDVTTWTFIGPDAVLKVEAETFIGLSVIGPIGAVERLQEAFAGIG